MPIIDIQTVVRCDNCQKLMELSAEYYVLTCNISKHGSFAKSKEKMLCLLEQKEPLYFCSGGCLMHTIAKVMVD